LIDVDGSKRIYRGALPLGVEGPTLGGIRPGVVTSPGVGRSVPPPIGFALGPVPVVVPGDVAELPGPALPGPVAPPAPPPEPAEPPPEPLPEPPPEPDWAYATPAVATNKTIVRNIRFILRSLHMKSS
jgi:hypothetical protein